MKKTGSNSMSVPKGAMEDQFEFSSSNEIPCLFTNDLTYSTYFEESRRVKQSLGGEWMFRPDPDNKGVHETWFRSETVDIDLSGWELSDLTSVFNAATGEGTSHKGFSWYRKAFKRDSVPEGYWSRLCFEGLLLRSEVYLNGHKLNDKDGGKTPFFLDVSDYLKVDEDNILVLRVDNHSDRESILLKAGKDHNPDSSVHVGIYGDVSIETIPENYILKARTHTVKIGDDTALGLDILMYAPDSTCRIDVTLLDPEGTRCGGTLLNAELDGLNLHDSSLGAAVRVGHCELLLENPQFWTPESANLYTVLIETASAGFSDKVVFRTALKSVDMDNEKILYDESLF